MVLTPSTRICELAIVGGITVESPLAANTYEGDSDDPFKAVYREFATIQTIGEPVPMRADASKLFTPQSSRTHKRSLKRTPGHRTPGSVRGRGVPKPPSTAIPAAVVDSVQSYCFPDGARVAPSEPPQSANKCHTFVTSVNGEAEYYGCCATFYREVDARPFWLAYECVHPRNTDNGTTSSSTTSPSTSSASSSAADAGTPAASSADTTTPSSARKLNFANADAGGGASVGGGAGTGDGPRGSKSAALVPYRPETVWMPTSVCLLSQIPYLSVLKACLTAVFPKLVKQPTEMAATLEELMSDLSCLPQPPAGPAMVGFKLHKGLGSPGTDARYITCRPPAHPDLPVIDVNLKVLFATFNISDLLLILTAMLTERRIIFMSRNCASLTPVIEGMCGLLYPFRWAHVYISVVPTDLAMTLVDAPVPFLLGINSDQKIESTEDALGPPITVNIDKRSVTIADSDESLKWAVPDVPSAAKKRLFDSADKLCWDYDVTIGSSCVHAAAQDSDARAQFYERFHANAREMFLQLMLDLFGDVRRHMLFDLTPPVFSTEKFLSGRPDQSGRDFFRAVFLTDTFRSFQKMRQKSELDYFDRRAAGQLTAAVPSSGSGGSNGSVDGRGADAGEDAPLPIILLPPLRNSVQASTDSSVLGAGGGAGGSSRSLRKSSVGSSSSLSLSLSLSTSTSGSIIFGDSSNLLAPVGEVPATPLSAVPAARKGSAGSIGGTPAGLMVPEPSTPAMHAALKGAPNPKATPAKALRALNAASRTTFYRTVVEMLTGVLDEREANSPEGNYTSDCTQQLQMRGTYKAWNGEIYSAFDDFDAIRRIDPTLFPKKLVLDILRAQSAEQRSDIAKKGALWAELCSNVDAGINGMPPSSFPPSPLYEHDGESRRTSVTIPAISGIPEVLAAIKRGDWIDFDSFFTVCKVIGITDDPDQADSLFGSLHSADSAAHSGSIDGGGEAEMEGFISSQILVTFVELWSADNMDTDDLLAGRVEFEEGEAVLKATPLIRLLGEGIIGTLVLTHTRLFLVPTNTKDPILLICDIGDLVAIKKWRYKIIIPPGVPCLRIYTQPDRGLAGGGGGGGSSSSVKKKKRGSAVSTDGSGSPVPEDAIEHKLLFFVERDSWFEYLNELVEAYRGRSATQRDGMEWSLIKASNPVSQAANNIELAEAIYKVTMQHGVGLQRGKKQKKKANPAQSSNGDGSNNGGGSGGGGSGGSGGSSPLSTRKKLFRSASSSSGVLQFSNPGSRRSSIVNGSPVKVDQLQVGSFRRIDVTAGSNGQKATVECLVHLPAPAGSPDGVANGSLWCGLGSGEVQVLEMPSGRCDFQEQLHVSRVTGMLLVGGDHMWVCSFDATISVIDVQSRRTTAVLGKLDDAISCLHLAEHGPPHRVWSGTLCGTLTEWDAHAYTACRVVSLPELNRRVLSCISLAETAGMLWCATGSSIVVIDMASGEVKKRTRAPPPPSGSGLPSVSLHTRAIQSALHAVVNGEASGSTSGGGGGSDEQDGPSGVYVAEPPGSPARAVSTPYGSNVSSPSRADTPQKRFYDEERVIILTRAAHSLVASSAGEIWSCASISGIVHVWDVTSFEPVQCGGGWFIDCGGFNSLAKSDTAIWGAANNGSIYMWDAESRNMMREMTHHTDAVRCVEVAGDSHVVSGSGSQDGSLVVWRVR